MKNVRTTNIIALVLNAILLGLVGYGAIFLTAKDNHFVSSLIFFTFISNLLAGLSALVSLCFNIYGIKKYRRLPRAAYLLQLTATVMLAITFLTVVCFLGPVVKISYDELFGSFSFTNGNFFMHLIIPIWALIAFIFGAQTTKIGIPHLCLTLIVPTLYGIFYCLNSQMEWVKYGTTSDWYGFVSIGHLWGAILIFVGILGLGFLFAFLLAILNRKLHASFVESPSASSYVSSTEIVTEEKPEEVVEEEVKEEPTPVVEESQEEKVEKPVEEKKPAPKAKKEVTPKKEQPKKESAPAKPAKKAESKKKEEPKKAEPSKEGNTKVYHLTKRKEDGMWAITFVGGQKAVKLFKTKKEAEAALAVLTENQGATALIRNSKGSKAGKFASSIKSEK